MDSFSDRSEKPTSRRLKKAREEGHFPYSKKFANALSLLGTFFLMICFSSFLFPFLKQILVNGLSGKISSDTLFLTIKRFAFLILTIFCTIFIAHGWQSRFLFSFKISQKRKRGSSHRIYFLLYTIVSWLLLGFILFQSIYFFDLSSLPTHLDSQLAFFKKELFLIILKFIVVFLVLGFLDYLVQRRFFYQEMYMTKQEVKEEFKEEEVTKNKR